MSSLLTLVEEELQAFLESIIANVTCLRSDSICTHLDVKEKSKVSIGINSCPEARQVVAIQPLISDVKVELSDEKGVEVKGCRIT